MIRDFAGKRFYIDKVELYYIEGPDNGETLILIPGQAGTWESYRKVLSSLSKSFKVYSVDVRGHGKSTWTPGEYSFTNIGEGFIDFIEEIVGKPAIVSGNSSGGLIALWLAANKPSLVKGIILEDAPLFSADWPRIKSEFVYEVLDKTARYLGAEGGPDYEGLFKAIKRPTEKGDVKELPGWLSKILAWLIKRYYRPGEPVDIRWLPGRLRYLIKSTSTFDPDFSRSWVDGRIYVGLDHEEALSRVSCPVLIIHADWYRTDKGLVGAMDDKDALHALELVPHAEYVRVHTRHVMHSDSPEMFVNLVESFTEKLEIS